MKTVFKRFTLGSVAVSSTGAESLINIGCWQGAIQGVIAVCASTDFDISIRNKAGQAANSIYEILSYVASNLRLENSNMRRDFENRDNPQEQRLYVIIKNDDASNATGNVELELAIEGDFK